LFSLYKGYGSIIQQKNERKLFKWHKLLFFSKVKMVFFKRGVSPLIATVLLVMITVSIGAAVMVVIQNVAQEGIKSTEEQGELVKCGTDVSVQVLPVASSYRICVRPSDDTDEIGNITLFLENTGLRDVVSWRITVIGSDGVYDSSSQGTSLAKGAIQGMRFLFNGTGTGVENISQVRLAPQISGGSGAITCIEPNLEWDNTEIQDWDLCADVNWAKNLA
jgi:flagellin-like protein